MYGETGDLLRSELAALLRQHRIQQRLGADSSSNTREIASAEARAADGQVIQQYRRTILNWCAQTVLAATPLTFSAVSPAPANPFLRADRDPTPVEQLARGLGYVQERTSASAASLELLTTVQENPVVEHWRQAARAAALAEHDTGGPVSTSRLTAAQARALVGDVAAITQALVVLDHRYRNIPGWVSLPHTRSLGWAALATALDVSLGQPDYTVDQTGWRPSVKQLRGPVKPGITGVLQAEHNLLVHLKAFPTVLVQDICKACLTTSARRARDAHPCRERGWSSQPSPPKASPRR
ncbi:hypothetical protein, partial [Nocardioides panacisoli]|uniref:hypothetical protein n=1 Tax=Nocardioides panacisoli TaxID=627624 RepID=UPI0031E01E3F